MILNDYNVGLEPEELRDMYKECIKDNSFLNIRAVENDDKEKFYKGFLEPLNFTPTLLLDKKKDHSDGYRTEEES